MKKLVFILSLFLSLNIYSVRHNCNHYANIIVSHIGKHQGTYVYPTTDEVILRSRIHDIPFAQRLASKLTPAIQDEIDQLLLKFKQGIASPGKPIRALGDGYYEIRGHHTGRIIVRQVEDAPDGRAMYDIIGKFQGHKGGEKQNRERIQNLLESYKELYDN